jgi:Uma2 family endonuclease
MMGQILMVSPDAQARDWRREMSTKAPRLLDKKIYEREAKAYLRSLPLEHFMESTPQATQREITLASLALVKARRADVHFFNELLVQYPVRGKTRTGKVVPDNMVVISDEPIEAVSSYNVPLEPFKPFWVMECVSPSNPRKDYDDSFNKYETRLRVPYYLIFHPDTGKLILYKHNQRNYVPVRPNSRGRYAIAELDIEVAVLDGWVRFWYQGELLPLPAEMQSDLDATKNQLAEERRRADEEKRRADELQRQLAVAERELEALRNRSNGTA